MDAELSRRVHTLRADPDIALLEGFHALKHALRFGARIELALASDPEAADGLAAELAPDVRPALQQLLQPANPSLMALTAPRAPHTGVVAFARRPLATVDDIRAAADRPIVLLENPRDLGNVGAVIRVAAAAGSAAVLTTGEHDPWDPRAIRGSAGLHFALPVLRVSAGVAYDRPLVAVDPEGDPAGLQRIPPGAVLAFGTERHGLSERVREAAAMRVRIPMRAGVSSLNLATAVAVVLYRSDVITPSVDPPGPGRPA